MVPELTPMRWPSEWKDPSALRLLKDSGINCLIVEPGSEFSAIREKARDSQLTLTDPAKPPPGIKIVEGAWPGVRMSQSGGDGAGPTGNPWVDSNGWRVRMERSANPGSAVWIDAKPNPNAHNVPGSYAIAAADSGAYGGRWIVTLDKLIAEGIATGHSTALEAWKGITASAALFNAHREWDAYAPLAIVGVISDFSGPNQEFSHELLNLLSRAGQHDRIIQKQTATAASFEGLRAVFYTDDQPPTPALKHEIMAFVERGGMLISGPKWGAQGVAARDVSHPSYSVKVYGKGRIAQSLDDLNDPYAVANDSVVLVSHRYDLVRFFNGGANASYYTRSQDGKNAVVHLLFYSTHGPDAASIRVAGRYRSARITTINDPDREIDLKPQGDGVEVHLPAVPQYVALKLAV